jgi:hypothetical protein
MSSLLEAIGTKVGQEFKKQKDVINTKVSKKVSIENSMSISNPEIIKSFDGEHVGAIRINIPISQALMGKMTVQILTHPDSEKGTKIDDTISIEIVGHFNGTTWTEEKCFGYVKNSSGKTVNIRFGVDTTPFIAINDVDSKLYYTRVAITEVITNDVNIDFTNDDILIENNTSVLDAAFKKTANTNTELTYLDSNGEEVKTYFKDGEYYKSVNGVETLFKQTSVAAPIISCNSTATEGTGVIVTITNYDSALTYNIEASGGTVGEIQNNGTFTWYMPSITEDMSVSIKVQASENGVNPSAYSNIENVLVSNINTLADDSMIFENATIVEENFESISGSLVGNTINAGTTIPALSQSTNTSLVVGSEIVEGQRVQVYYYSGDVERVIGSVSTGDTINIHDIFGDGSAVATYNLDGDANDLGGNYDGTASNVTYTDGKFGQCAVFNGTDDISIPVIDNGTSSCISMWVKWDDSMNRTAALTGPNFGGAGSGSSDLVYCIRDTGIINYYNNGNTKDSTVAITANVWTQIAYNRTASNTMEVYINGMKDITHALSGSPYNEIFAHIGNRHRSDLGFNGQIDQVRIFNRALTSEEVTTLYNENVAKYTTPMTLPSKPTKIVTKDNVFESITFNHPLGYNWATNDVKLTLDKPRLNILDESTNLSLVTFDRISNGDKLSLLPEGGLETIDFPIGSVTAEGFDNFSVVTYTGNGSEQHTETGINSVDFTVSGNGSGYWLDRSVNQVKNDAGVVQASGTCDWGTNKGVSKVHIKGRSSLPHVVSHNVYDGLRGCGEVIRTDRTAAELTVTDRLNGFTTYGFLLGADASNAVNYNGGNYIAYQTLYTHIKWGTTNHGKFYVEAYNPITKEGMIYYVGSGSAGHEIPHSMGVEIDFSNHKRLSAVGDWYSYDGTYRTSINTSGAGDGTASTIQFEDKNNILIDGSAGVNGSNVEYICYYKCKSETFTIGTYQGTGSSGNFIETLDVNGVARKPRRATLKKTDSEGNWNVYDSKRTTTGSDSHRLMLNGSGADYNGVDFIDINNTGFTLKNGDGHHNLSGGQYLYMVEFETDPVKYTTDISHLNLSEAPTTIFKDPLPKLETSVVADGADKSFTLRTPEEVVVDGNNVVIDYNTATQIGKNGSFRITSDDDTISKLNLDLTREA